MLLQGLVSESGLEQAVSTQAASASENQPNGNDQLSQPKLVTVIRHKEAVTQMHREDRHYHRSGQHQGSGTQILPLHLREQALYPGLPSSW